MEPRGANVDGPQVQHNWPRHLAFNKRHAHSNVL
jgi:hypothetical protein